jgi:hypothetical protein
MIGQNILEQEDIVKGLPDERLFSEAKTPSGEVPQFLIYSEIKRRADMRKRYAQQQEQMPSNTVSEQILQEGIGATQPVQMADGGIVRYAGGGFTSPIMELLNAGDFSFLPPLLPGTFWQMGKRSKKIPQLEAELAALKESQRPRRMAEGGSVWDQPWRGPDDFSIGAGLDALTGINKAGAPETITREDMVVAAISRGEPIEYVLKLAGDDRDLQDMAYMAEQARNQAMYPPAEVPSPLPQGPGIVDQNIFQQLGNKSAEEIAALEEGMYGGGIVRMQLGGSLPDIIPLPWEGKIYHISTTGYDTEGDAIKAFFAGSNEPRNITSEPWMYGDDAWMTSDIAINSSNGIVDALEETKTTAQIFEDPQYPGVPREELSSETGIDVARPNYAGMESVGVSAPSLAPDIKVRPNIKRPGFTNLAPGTGAVNYIDVPTISGSYPSMQEKDTRDMQSGIAYSGMPTFGMRGKANVPPSSASGIGGIGAVARESDSGFMNWANRAGEKITGLADKYGIAGLLTPEPGSGFFESDLASKLTESPMSYNFGFTYAGTDKPKETPAEDIRETAEYKAMKAAQLAAANERATQSTGTVLDEPTVEPAGPEYSIDSIMAEAAKYGGGDTVASLGQNVEASKLEIADLIKAQRESGLDLSDLIAQHRKDTQRTALTMLGAGIAAGDTAGGLRDAGIALGKGREAAMQYAVLGERSQSEAERAANELALMGRTAEFDRELEMLKQADRQKEYALDAAFKTAGLNLQSREVEAAIRRYDAQTGSSDMRNLVDMIAVLQTQYATSDLETDRKDKEAVAALKGQKDKITQLINLLVSSIMPDKEI